MLLLTNECLVRQRGRTIVIFVIEAGTTGSTSTTITSSSSSFSQLQSEASIGCHGNKNFSIITHMFANDFAGRCVDEFKLKITLNYHVCFGLVCFGLVALLIFG